MTYSSKVLAWQIAIGVLWIASWQVLATPQFFNAVIVASPGRVFGQIWQLALSGELWSDMASTMTSLLIGYASAVIVGTLIGIAMGMVRPLRDFLAPFLSFLNTMPRLALVPILVAWLGFGKGPAIALVFLLIVFTMIITVYASISDLSQDYIDHARTLGASKLQIAQTVYLPAVGIWILGSARVAIGLGFQAVIVAEFFGATSGLGYRLALGQQSLNTSLIYAMVLVVAILAIIGDLLLARLEFYVGRWQPR